MDRTKEQAPQILRIKEVIQRTGVPRSTVYAWIAVGDFPRPIKLGRRSVGWLEESVSAWIQSRSAE